MKKLIFQQIHALAPLTFSHLVDDFIYIFDCYQKTNREIYVAYAVMWSRFFLERRVVHAGWVLPT